MDDFTVIAIDIGGTSYRVALANTNGNIINRTSEPTRSNEGSEIGLRRIKETIRQTVGGIDFGKVRGIGVCAGGPLNPHTGVLLTPPSLPTWRNVPLKNALETEFNIPVLVRNDADLAALGEQRFGVAKGCSRVIYLTVSTGIGGGIVLDGQMLTGTDLSLAEIGHMIVEPNGPQCNCGGKGHLEPLASGTAIARIAAERIFAGRKSNITQLCGNDFSGITAEMVVRAMRHGDLLAAEVIEEAGTYLGIAITSLIHLFDPEIIIIGGGVSNAGELILEPIRQAISERIMPDFRNRARVVQSELGDNSGIMGAIAFTLDSLKLT